MFNIRVITIAIVIDIVYLRYGKALIINLPTYSSYMKKLFFLLAVIFFLGCETDLDVKAPYQKIPVSYCLLDQNESYHFVKVTKLFNGDLDANEMAKVRDSSEVDVQSIFVEELIDGNVVKTYSLQDTIVSTKEAGDFYYPDQKIYYFIEPNLNASSQYRLTVDIGGDEPAVATIGLIQNTNVFQDVTWQRFRPPGIISFASNGDLTDLEVAVVPPTNGKRTEVNMYFTYCTKFLDGSYDIDTIRYELGSKVILDPENPKEQAFRLIEGTFYSRIVSEIPDADETPNIDHRVPGIIFFDVVNAGEDLYYYMEVNAPTSAVFQERPPYTNFENGLGIFSARTTFNTIADFSGGVDGFNLNQESLEIMFEGEISLLDDDEKAQVSGITEKGFLNGQPFCN